MKLIRLRFLREIQVSLVKILSSIFRSPTVRMSFLVYSFNLFLISEFVKSTYPYAECSR